MHWPIDQRSSQTRFCSCFHEHWTTPPSKRWIFNFITMLVEAQLVLPGRGKVVLIFWGEIRSELKFCWIQHHNHVFKSDQCNVWKSLLFLLFCTNFDLAVFNVCCSCAKVGGGVSCKMPLLWLRLPHFYLQTCNWSKHWSSPIKLVLSNPRLSAETFGSVGDTFHTKLEKKIQFWAENLDFSGNGGAWQLLLGYFKVSFLTRWSFA